MLDSGSVIVHVLERPVGTERFQIGEDREGLLFDSTLDFTDRGGRVELASSLRLGQDLTPHHFSSHGRTYRFVNVDVDVEVRDGSAEVTSAGATTHVPLPPTFFIARGYAPVAAQALLVRYWSAHGRPSSLTVVPGLPTTNIAIQFRGTDNVRVGERTVALKRYSIDGLIWGRESLWLDGDDRFASLVTRVHILPLEAIRDDLKDALPALQAAAVRDRLADLARISARLTAVARGSFALTGARLVDASSDAPLENATVLVRDGRIAATGPAASTPIPAGTRVLQATGLTIIPGLWDMHGHISQIEWAPAYLSEGVTTARDMGGERQFLTAFRDTIDQGRGLGPRLLLAGLVDGNAPDAFGTTIAATPEQGRAVVDTYHAAGFRQIKLYTRVTPEVVAAITTRAHEIGMSVTGHIPSALSVPQAIDAGMDQIAHMPFRGNVGSAELDQLVQLLARRHIVVDPTMVWNELLGRAPETPVSSFEPGITHLAVPLRLSYESVRNDVTVAAAATRLERSLAALKALHDGGVTIVAGTDGAVPGYSVLRELELYIKAGFSPLEAIRAATRDPATAMGLSKDVGTIQAGKRADMLVLEADPLANISNVRRGRWVVANGVVYECQPLRAAAGFVFEPPERQ